jgi:4-diphosphocytidyl-2-methyl-D-erithritol synthase
MDRYAIIVAGGSGSRMGGDIPKQFMLLNGKPIILHTIEQFLALSSPVNTIVILPKAYREYWKEYCFKNGITFRHTLVSGGITRFHSVKNAMKYIPKGAVVAVHDGVRPFVSKSFLERMFLLGEEFGAVVPVVKAVDSMRTVADEKVVATIGAEGVQPAGEIVEREGYVFIQTPQLFHSDILIKAYQQAFIPAFTDDASVVERCGNKIFTTVGSRINIKLTQTEDMLLAEAILSLIQSEAENTK